MINSQTLKMLVLFAFLTSFSTLLRAQEGGILEEIVVTAQKREQSIQDIPIAITALSQLTLDRAGISSLEEFAYKVPGLGISGQNKGRSQINIRGISSGEVRRDNTRSSESVGIYFDEIPLSTVLYNPDLEPFDLERVEVLRGPQGTLYGSGSLAGTIRLISKAPVMNEFEGLIDTGFAAVEHGDVGYSIKGVVNLPIVDDTLAARIVVYQVEHAGWIDNLADGPHRGDDVNKNNKWGIRASALWIPTERLRIRPTYILQVIDGEGSAADHIEAVGVQTLVALGTLTPAQAFDTSGEYEQWKYLSQYYDDVVHIGNLVVEYDFDSFQFTSSSSFTHRDIHVVDSISDSGLSTGLFPAIGVPNVLGIGLEDDKRIESFSQEVRLTSTGDSDLQWLVGFYYNDISVDYHQPLTVHGRLDPAGISGTALQSRSRLYRPFLP